MTTADDLLFEPFNTPIISGGTGAGSILKTGIVKSKNSTKITIMPANPKQVYTDAANEMIDYAVKCFPTMMDIRKPSNRIPAGAMRLDTMTDRFHDGVYEFWVSCPSMTQPRQFIFDGRFGNAKVWRFQQSIAGTKIPQFVADWFWIDSSEGQLSAIEIGVILLSQNLRLHHVFASQPEAQKYYMS